MIVVTSGIAFIDVDAYGCCIAYVELLKKQGIEAKAVSTSPLNESITPAMRKWTDDFEPDYKPQPQDKFVVMDVSDPSNFDEIIDVDRVVEVIDHHVGFEEFWQKRIGDKAKIEFIGAACTLVYERWVKAGLRDQMSVTSARLLVAGILDNTLDFKARVTTDRDRAAYKDLMERANLPKDWPAKYFSECQELAESNLPKAITNDYKLLKPNKVTSRILAQMVIWNGSPQEFIRTHLKTLQKTLDPVSTDWCMNLISIHDDKSYLLSINLETQQKYRRLFPGEFEDNVLTLDKLWLRKEILRKAQEAN